MRFLFLTSYGLRFVFLTVTLLLCDGYVSSFLYNRVTLSLFFFLTCFRFSCFLWFRFSILTSYGCYVSEFLRLRFVLLLFGFWVLSLCTMLVAPTPCTTGNTMQKYLFLPAVHARIFRIYPRPTARLRANLCLYTVVSNPSHRPRRSLNSK